MDSSRLMDEVAARPRKSLTTSAEVQELWSLLLWGSATASALAFAMNSESLATNLACFSGVLRLPRVSWSSAGDGLAAEDDAIDFYFRRTEETLFTRIDDDGIAFCDVSAYDNAMSSLDCDAAAALFVTTPLYAAVEASSAKLLTTQHAYYVACCAALVSLHAGRTPFEVHPLRPMKNAARGKLRKGLYVYLFAL